MDDLCRFDFLDSVFRTDNSITLVLEENPKWELLAEVLQEIEEDIGQASAGSGLCSIYWTCIKFVNSTVQDS